LAVRHGFGGIDLHLDHIASVEAAREARRQLNEHGLQWGLFWLPTDFIGSDDAAYQQGLSKLTQMLPLVQAAGCTRTYLHVWPASDSLDYAANVAHHIRRLGPVVRLLNDHGVRLGLEFLGPEHMRRGHRFEFVYTMAQAIALGEAIGGDVGVVIDCFHWFAGGGTLEELRQLLPRTSVVNVHVNDAVAGRPREAQQNLERELPLATGIVDATGVLRALRAVGYDGPVIAEPFEPHLSRLRRLAPDDCAAEISQIMHRLFAMSCPE
jgi:sugar phosphate isomerase/epimerase